MTPSTSIFNIAGTNGILAVSVQEEYLNFPGIITASTGVDVATSQGIIAGSRRIAEVATVVVQFKAIPVV